MAHTDTHFWLRLRTLTFALMLAALLAVPALTTSVGAEDPVNAAAAELSNSAFVPADEFAPFRRLGISPVQVGLLLPAVQMARET